MDKSSSSPPTSATKDDMDWKPKTLIEPFKVKMVEPIKLTTRAHRERVLAAAAHNLFRVPADDVILDFLTDSGTGAMSCSQWAAMIEADEAYAGANAWVKFEKAFHGLFDFEHLLPTHQGRAAERLLFGEIAGKGKKFVSNTFFDTTRANVEATGARCVDIFSTDEDAKAGFGGNIDLERLRCEIDMGGVAGVIITATNNAGGGQPVSLANMRAASEICRAASIPIILDGCRFAENAYLIRTREPSMSTSTVTEIVRQMSSLFDVMTMSAKKDGLANTGGWLAVRDHDLAERLGQRLILTEGFTTYGGMAGRDMAAIAVGLDEVVDEHYLQYRVRTVAYLAERLEALNIPFLNPPGGHAIYLDAGAMLPGLASSWLPGQAVACALFVEGGIRTCEIGDLMFKPSPGDQARRQLVRLAFPRRVYTQAHVDYALEVIERVYELCKAKKVTAMKITHGESSALRHFVAKLEPVAHPA